LLYGFFFKQNTLGGDILLFLRNLATPQNKILKRQQFLLTISQQMEKMRQNNISTHFLNSNLKKPHFTSQRRKSRPLSTKTLICFLNSS